MGYSPEELKRIEEQEELARAEFAANWKSWKAEDVAAWADKWCTKEGTTRYRLFRILLNRGEGRGYRAQSIRFPLRRPK